MKSIKVVGPRILVKPVKLHEHDEVFKKARVAGIVIAESDEIKREKAALDTGTVVGMGNLAFHDWADGKPWCEVGMKVMWAKHSGRVVDYNATLDERLIIINDEDVICIIED